MKRLQLRLRRRRRAQGMTEYIIIVGLIAILLVGAVTKYKDSVEAAFTKASDKIKTDITDKMDGDDPPAGNGNNGGGDGNAGGNTLGNAAGDAADAAGAALAPAGG